jgi:type VI secretion system secreted protein Hcp
MAAVDYFLKIDGIKGESQDHKHGGEIEIQSFSWGASNSGSFAQGGGGGAGKVSMQDFHFTVFHGVASPKLLLACATGQHIPTGVLTCRKAGKEQQEFMKITFHDLLISSFQTGGGGGSINPTDQVSFNFSKIEHEYKEQKASGQLGGTVKATFDLKKMQGQ